MFGDQYQTFPINSDHEPTRVAVEVLADLVNRGNALRAAQQAAYGVHPGHPDSEKMAALVVAVGVFCDDLDEAKRRAMDAGLLEADTLGDVNAP